MTYCRPLASVLLAALLAACAAAPTSAPPAVPSIDAASATAGGHENLNATLWIQHAAEYEATMRGSFNLAIAQMEAALRDPRWDALPRDERGAMPVAELPPAIIVDADETMIDNSGYQARGIRDNAGFTPERWQAWVDERRARAVPGAVEFARRAEQLGVVIYYVTNRDYPDHLQATADNLRALGFAVAADNSNLMLMNDPRAPKQEKGERRRWIGARHRVLLMLGDNLGDFLDGVRVSTEARRTLIAPYADWWGQRWIMLPNPSYGSWETAIRSACAAGQPLRACLNSALRYD